MNELDGTDNKGARRQRDPGGSLGRRQGRRGRHGLPLYRYLGGVTPGPADPAHEHRQRRRACRQHARHPGVHDRAGRARKASAKPCAPATEVFHASRSMLKRSRPQHGRRRRGRLRAQRAKQRAGHPGSSCRAIAAAGYKTGRGCRHRARLGLRAFFKDGRTSGGRRPDARRRGHGDVVLEGLMRASIPSSRSRTAWPRTTGTGWQLLTDALGDKVQLVGDDLFVTNSAISPTGSRRRSPTRS